MKHGQIGIGNDARIQPTAPEIHIEEKSEEPKVKKPWWEGIITGFDGKFLKDDDIENEKID